MSAVLDLNPTAQPFDLAPDPADQALAIAPLLRAEAAPSGDCRGPPVAPRCARRRTRFMTIPEFSPSACTKVRWPLTGAAHDRAGGAGRTGCGDREFA
jgi:hypothetical protein